MNVMCVRVYIIFPTFHIFLVALPELFWITVAIVSGLSNPLFSSNSVPLPSMHRKIGRLQQTQSPCRSLHLWMQLVRLGRGDWQFAWMRASFPEIRKNNHTNTWLKTAISEMKIDPGGAIRVNLRTFAWTTAAKLFHFLWTVPQAVLRLGMAIAILLQ